MKVEIKLKDFHYCNGCLLLIPLYGNSNNKSSSKIRWCNLFECEIKGESFLFKRPQKCREKNGDPYVKDKYA